MDRLPIFPSDYRNESDSCCICGKVQGRLIRATILATLLPSSTSLFCDACANRLLGGNFVHPNSDRYRVQIGAGIYPINPGNLA